MSARHIHRMPFGAEIVAGGVRFRLWAPSARTVAVVLETPSEGRRVLEMNALAEGWFELTTPAAGPGTRYKFRIDGELDVPDPAARANDDLASASIVVDPLAYEWHDDAWYARPWHEAAIYELHVGTFTPEGTYDGVRSHLKELASTGITAIELMPLADFGGRWNWGYDGVLPFAPDESYGTPEQLKQLIDAAHGYGLMVFLDVVYNHFGPDGNYLHRYAPQFFTERRQTPWGAAIDYAKPPVRDFFINNALYWIQEYRFDGLRLDAVHEIVDERRPTILEDIAVAVHAAVGPDRHVHLVLENDDNAAQLLARTRDGAPLHYTAQWDDDVHHAAHVVLTREDSGYYADYADRPLARLGRGLAEGFIYQGERSPYRDRARGQPSADLPPIAFVNFLQNHDQVGNRAFGERLTTLVAEAPLRALSAILLLSPGIPMLFMGEEWGAREPFCFFTDFQGDLANAVREGRRKEFARFADFADPAARERIPDPQAEATYRGSTLDWRKRKEPPHAACLAFHRELLRVRRAEIAPRIGRMPPGRAAYRATDGGLLTVQWLLADGSCLHLAAQLSDKAGHETAEGVAGQVIWSNAPAVAEHRPLRDLPPWFVAFFLEGM